MWHSCRYYDMNVALMSLPETGAGDWRGHRGRCGSRDPGMTATATIEDHQVLHHRGHTALVAGPGRRAGHDHQVSRRQVSLEAEPQPSAGKHLDMWPYLVADSIRWRGHDQMQGFQFARGDVSGVGWEGRREACESRPHYGRLVARVPDEQPQVQPLTRLIRGIRVLGVRGRRSGRQEGVGRPDVVRERVLDEPLEQRHDLQRGRPDVVELGPLGRAVGAAVIVAGAALADLGER